MNIDVIKRMDGEFDVETITETFQNFYFNRMILDITALKDHFNIAVMQQLIAGIDSSKIILFLDNDPRVNNSYLSQKYSIENDLNKFQCADFEIAEIDNINSIKKSFEFNTIN